MLLLKIVFLGLLVTVHAGVKKRKCNDDTGICICVNKKGRQVYKEVTFPDTEDYDCTTRPRRCRKMRFEAILRDEGGFLPQCDSDGKFQPKQCINIIHICHVEPPYYNKCGPVKIQSKNYPDKYVGAPGQDGSLQLGEPVGFKIVSPGQNREEGTVTFEVPPPGSVMKSIRRVITFGPSSKEEAAAATFRIRQDKFFADFVSLEAVGQNPPVYLRHQNGVFKLSKDDGTDLMHNDASFKLLRSGPPQTKAECWCSTKRGGEIKGSRGGAGISCEE